MNLDLLDPARRRVCAECIQFLATLAIWPPSIWQNRMKFNLFFQID